MDTENQQHIRGVRDTEATTIKGDIDTGETTIRGVEGHGVKYHEMDTGLSRCL